MSCKENNICMDPTNAQCVDYEGTLGTNSKITSTCIDQEMVDEDLYVILDETIEKLDTADLGNLSINFPIVSGKINFHDVIKQYEIEISSLKTRVTDLENENICDKSITSCNLDFGILVSACGGSITTLGELLQVLLNQHNT